MQTSRRAWGFGIVALLAGCAVGRALTWSGAGACEARRADAAVAPRELATTVADGFTIASVGDTILAYPQSAQSRSSVPGGRQADPRRGRRDRNYEGNIIDGRISRAPAPAGSVARRTSPRT